MQRAFVGLSGGVDSAVSAALLKEQGYDVVGAFIKIWQPEFIECTWKEDRLDAMRVAVALDIPFEEVDLSEEYKKEVVDTMVADYARGITPNPDVLCNEKVKFGSFLKWARKKGADKLATGHYARIGHEAQGTRHSLLRGVDTEKDQSYFLHRLRQEDLKQVLFPIGEMTKREVRAVASRFGLPNAARPDSQGLCFVGEVPMKDFLKRYLTVEPGPVVDMKGKQIGEHEGAALYTIGQRHGFSQGGGAQYYVVSIDTGTNTLRVSQNREDATRKELLIEEMHWIGETPTQSFEADVQVRYREASTRAKVRPENTSASVTLEEPRITAPGQSLVVYDGEHCFGGGFISV